MEAFLDIIWSKIVVGVGHVYSFANMILSPLEIYGPLPVIAVLVLLTVLATKLFNRIYTTQRYEALKEEFTHYYKLRQEALACRDREKGKLLAKNIDQAKLNKVYYDFFFEGMLKNVLTIYLPCLIVAAYVNEAYKPDNLMSKFGQRYLFKFGAADNDPTVIGALFCYVALLLATYLTWFVITKAAGRKAVATEQ